MLKSIILAAALVTVGTVANANCVEKPGSSMMVCTSSAPMPVDQPTMVVPGVVQIEGNQPTAMQVMGATDDAARAQARADQAEADHRRYLEILAGEYNAASHMLGSNLRMRVR